MPEFNPDVEVLFFACIALLPELKLAVFALRAQRYNQADQIVAVPLSFMKRNMGDASHTDEYGQLNVCTCLCVGVCHCRSSSKLPKIHMRANEAHGDKAKLDFITAALGDQEPFGHEPELDCHLKEVLEWLATKTPDEVNDYRLKMTTEIEKALVHDFSVIRMHVFDLCAGWPQAVGDRAGQEVVEWKRS